MESGAAESHVLSVLSLSCVYSILLLRKPALLSVAKKGIVGGWNSANQSPRFTACLPFLTEDVHGIPEERMPIAERYSVAVALDFALGPNCGTRSDLSLSKQSAHATFLCRFVPMVAVMQSTEARG
jgi:hypothetical protein